MSSLLNKKVSSLGQHMDKCLVQEEFLCQNTDTLLPPPSLLLLLLLYILNVRSVKGMKHAPPWHTISVENMAGAVIQN